MANNYTQASFLIPCSAEQAALVEQAVLFVHEASPAEGNALTAFEFDGIRRILPSIDVL